MHMLAVLETVLETIDVAAAHSHGLPPLQRTFSVAQLQVRLLFWYDNFAPASESSRPSILAWVWSQWMQMIARPHGTT
jgi:hypothetical protein